MGSPPYIKTGIHNNVAAGKFFKFCNQRMILRMRLYINRLDAGWIINVGDGWNVGSLHVQFVDPKQRVLFIGHLASVSFFLIRKDQHVRAVAIDIEPIRYVFT